MIDVLVRAKNETHWLPQLLKSLEAQRGVQVRRILIIDNDSDDHPETLVSLFPLLNIDVVKFSEPYLPGRMLNFGIQHLVDSPDVADDDRVLIVSGHCFLTSERALCELDQGLTNSGPLCRAAYGRQLAMEQSDTTAVRDLALLYPNENRTVAKAASFNNAFSLITYEALMEHRFDSSATNLEDILWAADEIAGGFSLAYVASSSVAHHHGPHHGNSRRRLSETASTIQKFANVFHFTPARASVDPEEFLVVIITDQSASEWLHLVSEFTTHNRVVVWTTSQDQVNLESHLSSLQISNLHVIVRERDIAPRELVALYEAFPMLMRQLSQDDLESLYYLLFDDSYERSLPHTTPSLAATLLETAYLPALWPVVDSDALYFFGTADGSLTPNQGRDDQGRWVKPSVYRAQRGNGMVLTRAAMLNPTVAFEDFAFIRYDEVAGGFEARVEFAN